MEIVRSNQTESSIAISKIRRMKDVVIQIATDLETRLGDNVHSENPRNCVNPARPQFIVIRGNAVPIFRGNLHEIGCLKIGYNVGPPR